MAPFRSSAAAFMYASNAVSYILGIHYAALSELGNETEPEEESISSADEVINCDETSAQGEEDIAVVASSQIDTDSRSMVVSMGAVVAPLETTRVNVPGVNNIDDPAPVSVHVNTVGAATQRIIEKAKKRKGTSTESSPKPPKKTKKPPAASAQAPENSAASEIVAKKKRRRKRDWVVPRPLESQFLILIRSGEDADWKSFLGMEKKTFDYICGLVSDGLRRQDTAFRKAVDPEVRVACALRRFVTGSPFKVVSEDFSVGKSTAKVLSRQFEDLMLLLKNDYVFIPSAGNELKELVAQGTARWNVPQALGVVGESLFDIIAPKYDQQLYNTDRNAYSVITQVVVDANFVFRYVKAGIPGHIQENSFYDLQDVGEFVNKSGALSMQPVDICGVKVGPLLLGNQIHPLTPWMLTPYPGDQASNPASSLLNSVLYDGQAFVRQAFDMMKSRFRVNVRRNEQHIANVNRTIELCCMLHNICLSHNDTIVPQGYRTEMPHFVVNRRNLGGAEVRDAVAQNLLASRLMV